MPIASDNRFNQTYQYMMTSSPIMRVLLAGRLLLPLGMLLFCLIAGMTLILLLILSDLEQKSIIVWLFFTCLLAIIFVIIGINRLRTQLLKPLARLEQAVSDVCDGVRVPQMTMDNTGILGELVEDIGSISGELEEVYQDMDDRVARTSQRLHKQTTALKLLYDVAAAVNEAGDLDEMLNHFLRVLSNMLNAKAATVCIVELDGSTRLVGSMGITNPNFDAQAYVSGTVSCDFPTISTGQKQKIKPQCQLIENDLLSKDGEVVEVPLTYDDEFLGNFHIKTAKKGLSEQQDLIDLLSSIGNHLGMAIAKKRSDEEAWRLSIMEERSAMAHELHDSLAQTIASLRFQVRMLQDTLVSEEVSQNAGTDLFRLKNGIDEAHTELRELLNSFMAPIDQRGLNTSLELLAARFRQEIGVPIFFQKAYAEPALSASEEMQVVRIVQESLANIKKHAKPHTVRILLTCRQQNVFSILVEDDGVGFNRGNQEGAPGEHIGLTIMQERAKRLGGELRIESELGEGTRVELTYDLRTKSIQGKS